MSNPPVFGLLPDLSLSGAANFSDLGVIGAAGALNPVTSILTDATGTDVSNVSANPDFVIGYFNGARSETITQNEQNIGILNTAAALDEGGNFIDVAYGPLSLVGNYHLRTTSPAINGGVASVITALLNDIDGEAREGAFDIGADEVVVSVSSADTDGDGVLDSQDNCTLIANPSQLDADSDGYGNICDADLNNDGITNSSDIPLFATLFLERDAVVDFSGDGVVNSLDIPRLVSLFFKAPGPSGIAN